MDKTKSAQAKPVPELTAASIAKELGIDPRIARKALRAADIRAPYKASDKAKIVKVLKALDNVYRGKTRAEYETMLRRAYRQLVEGGTAARRGDETHQQWADRLGDMDDSDAKRLFHTMRVAQINLEALS